MKSTPFADRLPEIVLACQSNGVKRLELFGSRARADSLPNSDVDLLVEFKEPLQAGLFDRFLALREALERILACNVDLVEYSAIQNPILRKRIEQDKKTLYAA
jgi:predicted nucleotidyltransferase